MPFSFVLAVTPQSLLDRNIYKDMAIPLYDNEHLGVSLRELLTCDAICSNVGLGKRPTPKVMMAAPHVRERLTAIQRFFLPFRAKVGSPSEKLFRVEPPPPIDDLSDGAGVARVHLSGKGGLSMKRRDEEVDEASEI